MKKALYLAAAIGLMAIMACGAATTKVTIRKPVPVLVVNKDGATEQTTVMQPVYEIEGNQATVGGVGGATVRDLGEFLINQGVGANVTPDNAHLITTTRGRQFNVGYSVNYSGGGYGANGATQFGRRIGAWNGMNIFQRGPREFFYNGRRFNSIAHMEGFYKQKDGVIRNALYK